MATVSLKQIIGRVFTFLQSLFLIEFHPSVAWLWLLGIYWLWKRYRHLAIFLLILFGTDVLLSFNYGIPEIEYYYLPAYLIFSIFISCGVKQLI